MADSAQTLAYTGIGSRQTPPAVLDKMRKIAARLAARGYILRSGAAEGADSAFEAGSGEQKEIYLPWKGFGGSASQLFDLQTRQDAKGIAASLHPAWEHLKEPVRRLHTRNVFQVLGADLQTPSRFVICWTPDGAQSEQERSSKTGGTGTAIALAAQRGVPVINLARPDAMDRLAALVLDHPPGLSASSVSGIADGRNAMAGEHHFHRDNTIPSDGWIWVYGSNTAGRQGKGAAKIALHNFDAKHGIGRGPNGRSFAIPTKDDRLEVLPIDEIEMAVREFIDHARANPSKNYFVTRVGCVLAGYRDDQIAPLFAGAPTNCSFAMEWKPFIAPKS